MTLASSMGLHAQDPGLRFEAEADYRQYDYKLVNGFVKHLNYDIEGLKKISYKANINYNGTPIFSYFKEGPTSNTDVQNKLYIQTKDTEKDMSQTLGVGLPLPFLKGNSFTSYVRGTFGKNAYNVTLSGKNSSFVSIDGGTGSLIAANTNLQMMARSEFNEYLLGYNFGESIRPWGCSRFNLEYGFRKENWDRPFEVMYNRSGTLTPAVFLMHLERSAITFNSKFLWDRGVGFIGGLHMNGIIPLKTTASTQQTFLSLPGIKEASSSLDWEFGALLGYRFVAFERFKADLRIGYDLADHPYTVIFNDDVKFNNNDKFTRIYAALHLAF